jgi:hypothetical protein
MRKENQLKKLWQKMNLTLKWTVMLLCTLVGRVSFVTLGGEGEVSMTCSRPGHLSRSHDHDCLPDNTIHVSDFGGDNL